MIYDFLNGFGGNWSYPFLLILTGVACAAAGIWLLRVREDDPVRFGKISRNRTAGTILGSLVLFWCIPHASAVLPESMTGLLVPLAAAAVILSWWTLDHLFSRALGGFVILTAHFFLREGFAESRPGSGVFAVLCFIFGILGIFLSARPYRLGVWIRRSFSGRTRRILPCFLLLFSAGCLWTLIFHFMSGRGGAA